MNCKKTTDIIDPAMLRPGRLDKVFFSFFFFFIFSLTFLILFFKIACICKFTNTRRKIFNFKNSKWENAS